MIPLGTRLGSYQITSLLGQGGMGEVYRATDTKLNRDVALKFLPEQFTSDLDRLERFQREAHVLASLNHSNIAAIYGFEDSAAMRALVMELVEGSTLAERIAMGPVPVDEVLSDAKQIAEALEYAHERGVIHRDLKPANIKLTSDGKIKILDFGLAKAMSQDNFSTTNSNSPTLSLAATQAGVILGTAAYMSPEQAKGKTVDRRADIWAFGVILYEMLTGTSMFSAETVSETMAQVMLKEPDWNALPANTPSRLRDLLRRCLTKDPRMRLRDIGDARIAIEEVIATPQTDAPSSTSAAASQSIPIWRRAVPWVLAAALVTVSFLHWRENAPVASEQTRFYISPPEKLMLANPGVPRVSPDGRHVAFIATGEGGPRLWVRDLGTFESRPLTGTDGVVGAPFWSFDSRSIVFSVSGSLKKVEIGGGPPQTLCQIVDAVYGGFWTRDERIVFGGPGGIRQVPAAGGTVSAVTIVDHSRGEQGHIEPSLLPDGVHFLYSRFVPGGEAGGVFIASLKEKPEQQKLTRILPTLSMSAYVSSTGENRTKGSLLFVRENTLFAQAFDNSRLELTGDAVPVAEHLTITLGVVAGFSVSETGVLAYTSGGALERHLSWYDRQGKEVGTAWIPGPYNEFSISPDGTRVAVAREGENPDVHVFDFMGNRSIRLTSNPATDRAPIWSPDGKKILFFRNPTGMFLEAANGAGEEEQLVLPESAGNLSTPKDWSNDGHLIYSRVDPKTKRDLWVLNMDGDHQSRKFLHTEFNETAAKFSPEPQGPRYVAYVSDQSGSYEVYVTTFPDPSEKWPISNGGGYMPRWRRDGKELLYFTGEGKLMSVDVTLSPSFRAGATKVLFPAPIYGGGVNVDLHRWDLTPDGQKFLINTTSTGQSSPIAVVINWQTALKK
jgi:serine/threonine protein kinase